MKRIWFAVGVLLLSGCGIQPSGVADGGSAPTGVAPGVTLYFVDAHDRLQPQERPLGHLGTIAEAMAWLLSGPTGPNLRTQIASTPITRVGVSTTPDVVQITVPFTAHDVTPLGIDQIVCTALGVHVQGGGSRSMKVQILFTAPSAETDKERTCPLIK